MDLIDISGWDPSDHDEYTFRIGRGPPHDLSLSLFVEAGPHK
ncbi:hypothetical protein [Streptomyces sp. NPDC019890]